MIKLLIKKKAEKVGDQIKLIDTEIGNYWPVKYIRPMRKCCLCKNEFEIMIDKKYIVKTQENLMNIAFYDVMDCPYCGSQNLIWKRLQKVNKDGGKTNL